MGSIIPLDTQNTLIIFLSVVAVIQVILIQKLINEQTVIFYSPSNALCSSDDTIQIKHFKNHSSIVMCSPFHLVQSPNNEFLFIKTHRVLNRLSKCANVHYRKNQVLLWFTINSQSKLKKFSILSLTYLPRKTRYEI